MWRPTVSSDEIFHHGIQGMHWGQRNGPPYPLDQQTHNSVVKGESKTPKVTTQGDSTRRKRMLLNALLTPIFPLKALSVATDAVDELKEVNAKHFRNVVDKERAVAPIDKKTGLKKQDPPKTDKENLKRVNPSYLLDPIGARQNCTNCTMAMEMRLRGYEVEAQRKEVGRDGKKFAKEMFPKSQNKEIQVFPDPQKDKEAFKQYMAKESVKANFGVNYALAKKTITQLKTEPPGSRGQLLITWGVQGGHSVMYRITDKGKVEIWDGQINKVYNEREASKLIAHTVATQYQRLDNVDFNKKKIKEAVR